MKKLIFAAAAVTLLSLAVLMEEKKETVSPAAASAVPAETKEAPHAYDPLDAQKKATLAKEVAEAEIKLPRLPALSKAELEVKISEIDDHIRNHHYVERSNRGELSSQELLAFRKLMALRNQYFEQKIEFTLNDS